MIGKSKLILNEFGTFRLDALAIRGLVELELLLLAANLSLSCLLETMRALKLQLTTLKRVLALPALHFLIIDLLPKFGTVSVF